MDVLTKIVDTIIRAVRSFSCIIMFAAATLGLANVVARYAFHKSFIWGDEAVIYLFIWFLFTALCYVTYEKDHLSTNLVGALVKNETLLLCISLFTSILTLGISTFMVYVSFIPIKTALMVNRHSDSGVIPMAAVFFAVTAGYFFNCIASAFLIIKDVLTMFRHKGLVPGEPGKEVEGC